MTSDERRFAWQVGPVLAALGGFLWWRGRPWGPVLVVVGAVLVVLGLVAPRLLVAPRRAWMALGNVMHRVMSPIVTAVLYFAVVTPVGWVRRTIGQSPLRRRRDAATYWTDVSPPTDATASPRERMRHPY